MESRPVSLNDSSAAVQGQTVAAVTTHSPCSHSAATRSW